MLWSGRHLISLLQTWGKPLLALQSLGMRNVMPRLSSALLLLSATPASAQAAFVCITLSRWLQGEKNLQPFEEGAERISRA